LESLKEFLWISDTKAGVKDEKLAGISGDCICGDDVAELPAKER